MATKAFMVIPIQAVMSSEYEFTNEDNKVFEAVSLRLLAQAIILIFGGLLSIILALVQLDTAEPIFIIIQIVSGILFGYTGVLLFPAVKPFKNVSTSEGDDIKEVVTGFSKFNDAIKMYMIIIPVIILLDIVLIFVQGGN